MTSFSSKLCNPTPFEAKIDYDRGIKIRVNPFDSVELTEQQFSDFLPGKPGSEVVSHLLDYNGLFLMDSDRPYDNQALGALRKARGAKKSQYDAVTRNIIDRRSAQGIAPNEEALEETLRQMGYVSLREKIAVLDEQIKKFESVCGPDTDRTTRAKFDPARTIFIMDPPREFPSVAAMEFFLTRNPEIAARHKAFQNQVDGTPNTKEESSVAQLLKMEKGSNE